MTNKDRDEVAFKKWGDEFIEATYDGYSDCKATWHAACAYKETAIKALISQLYFANRMLDMIRAPVSFNGIELTVGGRIEKAFYLLEVDPEKVDKVESQMLTEAREGAVKLDAENRELWEMLESLEWSIHEKFENHFCPSCTHNKKGGHRTDCKLSALLKRKPV